MISDIVFANLDEAVSVIARRYPHVKLTIAIATWRDVARARQRLARYSQRSRQQSPEIAVM